MLPREFTEEQVMFRDAYRKFLASEIVPHMEDLASAGNRRSRGVQKGRRPGFSDGLAGGEIRRYW